MKMLIGCHAVLVASSLNMLNSYYLPEIHKAFSVCVTDCVCFR